MLVRQWLQKAVEKLLGPRQVSRERRSHEVSAYQFRGLEYNSDQALVGRHGNLIVPSDDESKDNKQQAYCEEDEV